MAIKAKTHTDPVLEAAKKTIFGGDITKELMLMSLEDMTRLNVSATAIRRKIEAELVARKFRSER